MSRNALGVMAGILRALWRALRLGLMLAGVGALLVGYAGFSPWPWRLQAWLADVPDTLQGAPDYIVIMGGGGIPSPSGLMRTYHGAQAARLYPEAQLVLVMPADLEHSQASQAMRDELVLRGIAPERILVVAGGRNTREQALCLASGLDALPGEARLLVITTPEHLRRTFGAFRRVGFVHLAPQGTHPESIDADLEIPAGELASHHAGPLPDMGGSLQLRYAIWNNWGYFNSGVRELIALGYYRLQGWL